MAVKKAGLGKGLDSLIADKNDKRVDKEDREIVEKVIEKVIEKPVEMKLKITEIEPNREQPRKEFNEDSLEELADSIKEFYSHY